MMFESFTEKSINGKIEKSDTNFSSRNNYSFNRDRLDFDEEDFSSRKNLHPDNLIYT